MKMNTKKYRKGYTLAELLMVVAITGIIAAFAYISVINHQRELKLTENDNIAREIFIGAQNHLSEIDSTGAWEKIYENKKNDTDFLGTEFDQSQDTTYNLSYSGEDIHDFRTITVNENIASDKLSTSALKYILPAGSIDETIRKGETYIIEYDAKTATVYGVFYTDGSDTFNDADVLYIDQNEGRTNEDFRQQYDEVKKEGVSVPSRAYAVGYYGGADALKTVKERQKEEKLKSPTIEFINAERLILKVTDTNNKTVSKLITDNPEVKIYQKGTDTAYTITNGYDSKITDKNSTTYYYILDSIVDDGKHFANQFPSITPGSDIYAEVKITYQNKKTASATTKDNDNGKKYANSLFANSSTSEKADIANARHLENLSYEISPSNSNDIIYQQTEAELTEDISWQNKVDGKEASGTFFYHIADENSKFFKNNNKIYNSSYLNTDQVYFNDNSVNTDTYIFYGIVNGQLTSFNGNYHTLSYFNIKPSLRTTNTNDSLGNDVNNGYAALFSAAENDSNQMTIGNLTLDNFQVTGTKDISSQQDEPDQYCAGLFGYMSRNMNYYVNNVNVNSIHVNGTSDLKAGLIGYVNTSGEVSINNTKITDAEIVTENNVIGNTQYSGGMIGAVGIAGSTINISNQCEVRNLRIADGSYMSGGLIGCVNTSGSVSVSSTKVDGIYITGANTGSYQTSAAGMIGYIHYATKGLNITDSTSKDIRIDGASNIKGGLIGYIYTNGNVAVANTTVTNVKLGDDGNKTTGHTNAAGGMIGQIGYAYYSGLTIDNCSVINPDIDASPRKHNYQQRITHAYLGGLIGLVSNAGGNNLGNNTVSCLTISDTAVKDSSENSGKFQIGYTERLERRFAGGFIGYADNSVLNIYNCGVLSEDGKVNGFGDSTGGFIGIVNLCSGIIQDSYSSVGQVQDSRSNYTNSKGKTDDYSISIGVGGFIGSIEDYSSKYYGYQLTINNCYSGGRTSGAEYKNTEKQDYSANVYGCKNNDVGGFIGRSEGTVEINNCFSTCSVKSDYSSGSQTGVGGFIGDLLSFTNIKNSYSTGLVTIPDNAKNITNGISAGAFIGRDSSQRNSEGYGYQAEYSSVYVLDGINSNLNLLGSVFSGNSDSKGQPINENSSDTYNELCSRILSVAANSSKIKADDQKVINTVHYDESLSGSYPFKSTAQLAGSAETNSEYFGDWPLSDEGNDVLVLYYEKVRHEDDTIDWYYRGYKEKFNLSGYNEDQGTSITDGTQFHISEIETSDTLTSRYATSGHPFVDDTADLKYTNSADQTVTKDPGNELVIEDGYAILVKKANSFGLDQDQVYFRQGDTREPINVKTGVENGSQYSGNQTVYTSSYDNLTTNLGLGNIYNAYVLNPDYFQYKGESSDAERMLNDGFTILYNKPNDNNNNLDIIGKFYLNPLFANCMGTTVNNMPSTDEYQIRSARQLTYLMDTQNHDNANDTMTSAWNGGKNYVITQTMDIDYNCKYFTECGSHVTYSSKEISGSMDVTYQGASDSTQYRHIIRGMSQPFTKVIHSFSESENNVPSYFGQLKYLHFDQMNSNGAIVEENNNGHIDGIDITDSYFSGVVGGENHDYAYVKNVKISGSESTEWNGKYYPKYTCYNNAIAGKNCTNALIQNITIDNCNISSYYGICGDNAGKVDNIKVNNTQIYKAENNSGNYVYYGNGIANANTGIISNITFSETNNHDTTIYRNGICETNTSTGSIDQVHINSGVQICGDGICGTSSVNISNVTIQGADIKCDGIAYENNGPVNTVNIIDSSIGYNGISTYNLGNGVINNVNISGSTVINTYHGITYQNKGQIKTVKITGITIKDGYGIALENIENGKIEDAAITGCTLKYSGIVKTNSGSYIRNVTLKNSDIAYEGIAETNSKEISDVQIINCIIGGNGAVRDMNGGSAGNITLENVLISGNGFAKSLNNANVYSCNIINAQIGKNGFAESFNNGSIIDCHIYADKDIYVNESSNDENSKFVLTDSSIGGAWKDDYDLYHLTTIGLKPGTQELTSKTAKVSGFIGSVGNNNYWPNIYGCSVTASIYGQSVTNGFSDTISQTKVYDCYTNVIIHAGYGFTANSNISADITSNGFARVINNSTLERCQSSGMLLCSTYAKDKIKASGFIYQISGWARVNNSYSGIWYIQPSDSNVFVYQNSGNMNSCGYLFTGGVKNSKVADGVTKYTASDLAGLSDGNYGLKATADTTKPYYIFVNKPENGTSVYPYPVPHEWKYENNSITDKSTPQTWYGDWYEKDTTESAIIESYDKDADLTIPEDTGGDTGNTGEDTGNTGGDTGNTGGDSGNISGVTVIKAGDTWGNINPTPEKISDLNKTFSSSGSSGHLDSGTLIQDGNGTYILLYGNSSYYDFKPDTMTAQEFVAKNNNAEIVDSDTTILITPDGGFTMTLPAGTIAKDGDSYYVLNYKQEYNTWWHLKPSGDSAWAKITSNNGAPKLDGVSGKSI